MDTSKVTRVEVIDHSNNNPMKRARAYGRQGDDIEVELSLQDDEQTLKVFIKQKI